MKHKILILFIFTLFSCSNIEFTKNSQKIVKFEDVSELSLNFKPDKVKYSVMDSTFYIKEDDKIHIYKNNDEKNIIGGIGLGSSNFQNLSDISIDNVGNLFILDSFEKKIKKFNHNGKYITSFSLNSTDEPILMDISQTGTFFIYDSGNKNFVIIDNFDSPQTFGEFQVENPSELEISSFFLKTYNPKRDLTSVFDNSGYFIEDLKGHYSFDNFGQKIKIEPYKISSNEKQLFLNINKIISFEIERNLAIITTEQKIFVKKIIYEKL